MLNYNQIKERVYIVLDDTPYEVLDSNVFRKQQRKPVNQTKLRNLLNGSVKNHTFHNNDTVEEAEITREKYIFSYSKPNRQTGHTEYWFFKDGDKSDRVNIDEDIIKESIPYLKSNAEIDAIIFDEKVIGIKLPIKMTFKVKEAPPAVKGNTATGATKLITLETGMQVTAPIFINQKDKVVINTETGSYVERA